MTRVNAKTIYTVRHVYSTWLPWHCC